MTSPFLDKPLRTYREALIDNAEAAAKRRGFGNELMFVTLFTVKRRTGAGSYVETYGNFTRIDEAAEDAWHEEKSGRYAGTLMIKDGTCKLLDLSEHGEELAKERELEEAEEHRDRRGLTYGVYR